MPVGKYLPITYSEEWMVSQTVTCVGSLVVEKWLSCSSKSSNFLPSENWRKDVQSPEVGLNYRKFTHLLPHSKTKTEKQTNKKTLKICYTHDYSLKSGSPQTHKVKYNKSTQFLSL